MKTLILSLTLVLTLLVGDAQSYSVKTDPWGQMGTRMGEGMAEAIRRDQDWRMEQQKMDIMREQLRIQQEMIRQQNMNRF